MVRLNRASLSRYSVGPGLLAPASPASRSDDERDQWEANEQGQSGGKPGKSVLAGRAGGRVRMWGGAALRC